MRVSICMVAALMIAACRKTDVIDEKTFADCYARILVIKTTTTDSTAAAEQVRQVFAANHLTKEQMQEQLRLYADEPERYRKVLAEINDRLRMVDSTITKP